MKTAIIPTGTATTGIIAGTMATQTADTETKRNTTIKEIQTIISTEDQEEILENN